MNSWAAELRRCPLARTPNTTPAAEQVLNSGWLGLQEGGLPSTLLLASFQPERFSQTQSGHWLFAFCRTPPNHSAREGEGREAQQRHDTSGRRV